MNVPERNLKISSAPGIYVLRTVPAKTRASARRAAGLLLIAMRRTKHGRARGAGLAYLKEVRAARYGR